MLTKNLNKNLNKDQAIKDSKKKNKPWLVRDFSSKSKLKAPLSCRNASAMKTLSHYTTEELGSEYEGDASVIKKKLHFDFPI